MTVSVALAVSPSAPAHGATVTATYTVIGNDPVPEQVAAVTGTATIGGTAYAVETTITKPGTPALPETFALPSCPGLTFAPTADPRVFTAVVP